MLIWSAWLFLSLLFLKMLANTHTHTHTYTERGGDRQTDREHTKTQIMLITVRGI